VFFWTAIDIVAHIRVFGDDVYTAESKAAAIAVASPRSGDEADGFQLVETGLSAVPPLTQFPGDIPRHVLVVNVRSGRNLFAGDLTGTSDPYAIVEVGGLSFRTKTQVATLNPTFDECFFFPIKDPSSEVRSLGLPRLVPSLLLIYGDLWCGVR